MFVAASLIVLALILTAACLMIYQLVIQQGRLMLRIESLERHLRQQGIMTGSDADGKGGFAAGSVLNDFELPTLSGGTMTLSQYRGRQVLLVFFNPSCEFCREMLPGFGEMEAAADPNIPVLLIISQGAADENRRLFEQYGVKHPVLLQEKREVAELFRAFGTPTGYLVNERGVTISGLLKGSDPIVAAARQAQVDPPLADSRAGRAFSRSVRESQLVRDGLKAGTPAPHFRLPQVNGSELSIDDFRGQNVLLVFSDPECAPCDRLAPKLENVHRTKQNLRVIVISRGDIEANRAKIAEFGLTFPVLLQHRWEVSRAYGMFATPIGYLIDNAGILGSDVLFGADAILKAAARKHVGSGTMNAKELASR